MGRRALVIGVVTLVIAAAAIAAWRFRPAPSADEGRTGTGAGWRADPTELVTRIEHLAGAGEADAAASVLAQLLKRDGIGTTGLDDRARMAVARGYLKVKRTDEALAQVAAIPWADKSRVVAAQILGLELAIRWQGLFDNDGLLVPAAIGPRLTTEAPQGLPQGRWLQRWDHYRQLAQLLDRGAHMVTAEGGLVEMPGERAMMQLSRHDHGDLSDADLLASLGQPRTWTPSLALAVCRLRLAEFDVSQAFVAAETLWSSHPGTPQAGDAYRLMRVWQLERRLASGHLPLWGYPDIEARLDALAPAYAESARDAEAAVAKLRELNQWGMASAMAKAMTAAEPQADLTIDEPVTDDAEELMDRPERRVFALALAWNGLQLACDRREVPLGESATLRVTSVHRGVHSIRVYRLADRSAWDAMCKTPSNASLPAEPVVVREAQMADWASLGEPTTLPISLDGLGEGFYVATVQARGCPTIVLDGFTVVDPDVYLIAGRDEVVAWVVSRANGHQKPGEPLVATLSLVRDAEHAAGRAWEASDPMWRSGFTEGFTGEPSKTYVADAQRAAFDEGNAAGRAASIADPPYSVELAGASGDDGVARFPLPTRLRDRSYTATVTIARPGVVVARDARVGPAADWTAKAVAWADRPLARPGETVHWKMVMRDLDGYAYRLPVGELELTLRIDDQVLWSGTQAISDAGTVGGEIAIPPGAAAGRLTVSAGSDGPRHGLAAIARVELPPIRYDVVEDDLVRLRAGETVRTGISIRDTAGQPLSGIDVSCEVSAFLDGANTPCPQPQPAATDVAGIAHVSFATIPGAQALYRATFSFAVDHHRYRIARSWQATSFPFPIEAVVRDRQLSAVDSVRLELRFPADAKVTVRLVKGEQALGEELHPRGAWPLWSESHVPLDRSTQNADAVEVSTAVAGGGRARLRIPITITAPPISAGSPEVQLSTDRLRTEPGATLGVTLGLNSPGRDVLLVGGTRTVQLLSSSRLDGPARRLELAVASDWAPNIAFQAIAYLPGRGFTATARQDIEVNPVDRLLRVVVTPEREEYHPGETVVATVAVHDWKGAPAANVSLSLGVVNELLYQLAADETPDLFAYFYGYRRAYALVAGTATPLPAPAASLWQAVAWRWQSPEGFACIGGGEMASSSFGSRHGGGQRRLVAKYGGSRGSEAAQAMLVLESGVAIAWVGDLRTDGTGQATLRFTLPMNSGHFRCTARANSTDAQLLVGEVRMGVTSRQPFGCELHVPEIARAGDLVQADLSIASYEDAPLALSLELPDGSRRGLELAPRSRRGLPVRVRIGDADGEVREAGGQLGRVATLRAVAASSAAGGTRIEAVGHCLVAADGVPRAWAGLVGADASGAIPLPWPVAAGSTVRVRCRAWPDASARRDALAERARAGAPNGGVAALAWLEAPAGDRRAKALAACWGTLGNDVMSVLARQAAARRGEAFGSLGAVPDGAEGDWLLARGRFDGLLLGNPRGRGHVAQGGSDREAAVVTAIAEGWPEGRAWWPSIHRELLLRGPGAGALALALGIDAARMTDDAAAREQLIALLGRADWSQPLAQALALAFIPSGPGTVGGTITIAGVDRGPATDAAGGAATPIVLDAGASSEWLGIAGESFSLSSTPGAMADLDLLVQAPAPPLPGAAHPRSDLYEAVGEDGYALIPPGRALWPGRPLLLRVSIPQDGELVVRLPSVLRFAESSTSATIIEREAISVSLDSDVERAARLLQGGDRASALETFFAMCQRLPLRTDRYGPMVQPGTGFDATGEGASAWRSYTVSSREPLWIALTSAAEGSASWPPLAFAADLDLWQAQLPDVEVGIGAVPALPVAEFGLPSRSLDHLRLMSAKASDEDLRVLLFQQRELAADGDPLVALLDPRAHHDPFALMAHPLSNQPGHWSATALRAWCDGELMLGIDQPQLRRWLAEFAGLHEAWNDDQTRGCKILANVRDADWDGELAHPTMRTLNLLAEADASLRRSIARRLPVSMAPAPHAAASARTWYARLASIGAMPARDYDTWAWEQDLDGDLAHLLGNADGVEGWVAFLRERCALDVRIGAGVPAEIADLGQVYGPRLGSTLVAGTGHVLVRVGNGLELRPAVASALAPDPLFVLNVEFTEERLSTVIAHFDTLLANHGLPPLAVDPAFIDGDLRVTCTCRNQPWRSAATLVATLIGAEVEVVHGRMRWLKPR